jgi:glycosyltransferase involved in cell wall biosynthesis
MVFAEAMACHLPIIGSSVGGVVDLVRPENGILIPQGDVEMLKSAILKIKDSPQLRMQMGKNSRRRVELYYSWASVGARYEAVYQRVLGHASKDTK